MKTHSKLVRTLLAIIAPTILLASCGKKQPSQPGAHSGYPASPEAPSMPWQDPTYNTDTRATMAESRPGPDEAPDSWTEWLKHHEDRKRWVAEKPVDILMVGDSIVFGWAREGRPAWDAWYADRNAVNIGSSGDRTYHMLWHFQNGGLDGMKDRNPKVVVVMIGTNNRGEPETKGQDTAYGVLALLKEIHAKLPQSKILLLPIFPRGKTPDDEGRRRNEEINQILQTYVDNQTVHWLDLSGIFLDAQGNLRTDLMPDALHPNLDGYWEWAKAMEPTLAKLLETPPREIDGPTTFNPVPQPAQLGKNDFPNPDFTKGDVLPSTAKKDWNLGATGARGWMYHFRLHTALARQILITSVAPGSPADGHLQKGDVVLGINYTPFRKDPREELGKALTTAEAADGKLTLIRWRAGQVERIALQLPVLGSYSPTAPYDCPKSEKILNATAARLAERMAQPGYDKQNPIPRALNALGLLATGDAQYQPLIKREAEWAAAFSAESMATWYYGYISLFLSEYIIATGDPSVLPGLRRMALEAAKGQSIVGSWGHKFALPDGRLPGYGMMNSPGAVLTIGLALARDAGVDAPEVKTAIDRSNTLLNFYTGKGAIPYGDHAPWMQGHEDNGKCGMVAVLFDQTENHKGAEFFAKMSTASHTGERDQGHTGNFFNMAWAMPGVSRGGPHATGAWMQEFGAWYFDLARKWDMTFPHQGPPQLNGDSYAAWDATGVYLIAYAMPRKAVRLTGSRPSIVAPIDASTARQLIADGRGVNGHEPFTSYDRLPVTTLMKHLASGSPIVRERAGIALGRRKDVPVEPLIAMLDAPTIEARQGACTALKFFKIHASPAVPKLRELLNHEDLWLRVKAAEALAAIGEPAMVAVPDLLRMLARGPTPEDPRGMEQRYLADALFSSRSGMLLNSMATVDQAQLFDAVRAGLRNQDGRTRGIFSSVYEKVPFENLKPLLPAIHQAILDKSPSGEMFDGQIQFAGLDLYSRHHISQGIEMIAEYTRTQKPHGSQESIKKLLEMLKRYGAHAQRAIPILEQSIHYFENEEKDFPRALSLQKAEDCRKTIAEIRAMTAKPPLVELGF